MKAIKLGVPIVAAPTEPDSPPQTTPILLSYLGLSGLGLIGVLLIVLGTFEADIPLLHSFPALAAVIEHTASALVVACVIGLSYERILHKHREAQFQRLFWEHRQKTFEALTAYLSLKPKEIFSLLRDIATQTYQNTSKIPTLYRPSRAQNSEYTFADSTLYFDAIVEVGRTDIIEVLQQWVGARAPVSLKFLASDFIGRYRLVELRPVLVGQYEERLRDWTNLDSETRAWVLNYLWAASRCEPHPYRSLANVLKGTPHHDIREWILFVPQQMPEDPDVLPIIVSFLRRSDAPTLMEMKLVVRGLSAVYGTSKKRSVLNVFSKYAPLFRPDEIREEVRHVWSHAQRSPDEILRKIGKVVEAPA